MLSIDIPATWVVASRPQVHVLVPLLELSARCIILLRSIIIFKGLLVIIEILFVVFALIKTHCCQIISSGDGTLIVLVSLRRILAQISVLISWTWSRWVILTHYWCFHLLVMQTGFVVVKLLGSISWNVRSNICWTWLHFHDFVEDFVCLPVHVGILQISIWSNLTVFGLNPWTQALCLLRNAALECRILILVQNLLLLWNRRCQAWITHPAERRTLLLITKSWCVISETNVLVLSHHIESNLIF